jgi:phage terminase small subunit
MPLPKKTILHSRPKPTIPPDPIERIAKAENTRAVAARRPIHPRGEDEAGLNPKQRRFVQHYMLALNATQAALRAGYSSKGAEVAGSTLLSNPKVASEVKRLQSTLAIDMELTKEMVVRELRLIGFANMQDFMVPGHDGAPVLDFSNLTRDQAAALQEVTVEEFKDGRSDKREVRRTKFKLAAKKDALELLGKHLGLFKEEVSHKHEHHHTVLGNILLEIDAEARAKVIEHEPGEPDEGTTGHDRG